MILIRQKQAVILERIRQYINKLNFYSFAVQHITVETKHISIQHFSPGTMENCKDILCNTLLKVIPPKSTRSHNLTWEEKKVLAIQEQSQFSWMKTFSRQAHTQLYFPDLWLQRGYPDASCFSFRKVIMYFTNLESLCQLKCHASDCS